MIAPMNVVSGLYYKPSLGQPLSKEKLTWTKKTTPYPAPATVAPCKSKSALCADAVALLPNSESRLDPHPENQALLITRPGNYRMCDSSVCFFFLFLAILAIHCKLLTRPSPNSFLLTVICHMSLFYLVND